MLASNVDGILRAGALVSRVRVEEISSLVEGGTIAGGMRPKIAAAADAPAGGVTSAHVLNGMKPDTLLLEVLPREGCGTKIMR